MKKLPKVINISYKVDRINEKKISLINMIYIFIICSFLGWGFEVIFCYFKFGYIMNRGMLYGPFCSIYGIGGIILYLLFYNVKTTKNNIILMDEPGVYLHANAQKELTKLFSNLIKN